MRRGDENERLKRWMASAVPLLAVVLILGLLPGATEGAPTAEKGAVERAADAVGKKVDRRDDAKSKPARRAERSNYDRLPIVSVSGVNSVAPAVEARMARNIVRTLEPDRAAFARCYRRHARGANRDTRVTVDFTVTTRGVPVGITVFSKHQSLKGCLSKTIAGHRFTPAAKRHPVARVELYF